MYPMVNTHLFIAKNSTKSLLFMFTFILADCSNSDQALLYFYCGFCRNPDLFYSSFSAIRFFLRSLSF